MSVPDTPRLSPVLPAPPANPLVTAVAVLLGIVTLYFGQDIFIPFALAILLAFVLAPIVNGLRKLRIPRLAAILLAVGLAVTVIAGLSVVVGSQLIQLANNLPGYQTTIRDKLHDLVPTGEDGMFGRLSRSFDRITEELSKQSEATVTEASPAAAEAKPPRPEPIPVIVEADDLPPMTVIQSVALPLIKPLLTAGIVIVFVIFVLLERDDLRERFIKLIGKGDLQNSTDALNEAASRVSRYLLMQVIINVSYGIPIGIGLFIIGVPNAVLWGLLAAVLRFIPYVGAFLAMIFPLALAFAVDPGWSMLLWTAALFICMELISNNFLEPWLYGTSTGLSSIAVMIAAIFWTTLWGPVGLILATPLTVCFIVIGRYIPQLQFLEVLLGSEPVLQPYERLYQRLLSGNTEEAVEIAEDFVEEHDIYAFCEEMALPALRLAENARQQQRADVQQRRLVAEAMREVIEDSVEHHHELTEKPLPLESDMKPRVLIAAGRTELDLAAAEIVAFALQEEGITSRVLPPSALAQQAFDQIDFSGVDVVCLSYLSPRPQVFARQTTRRLRRRAPHLKIILCLWSTTSDGGLLARNAVHAVTSTVIDTVGKVSELVPGLMRDGGVAGAAAADDALAAQDARSPGGAGAPVAVIET